MELCAEDFGKDFAWGVSTAAYQIEGAHLKHGKGPSIWDEFTHTKGKIARGQNGDIACDFYQNYHQDIALMNALHIPNFRFSISWSRIFPEGTGKVNRAGVDYYHRMIDFCHELEIEPWITLYHWDLPLELEIKGGWTNRDVVGWFTDYVSFCIKTFGDRVKNWMILNEPMVFTGAGYFLGVHAPGKKSLSAFLRSAHHATLCTGEGERAIRSMRSGMNVGSTYSFSHIEPLTENEIDVLAAKRIDAVLNRTFIEATLGMGYPVKDIRVMQGIEQYMKDGDEHKMKADLDFVGVQTYTREIVAHSYFTPFINARIVKADERNVPRTLMNWEVNPESIYHILKKVGAYANIPAIIVTENGAAFEDVVEDGRVNDVLRRQYLMDHIQQVLNARNDGVRVNGYFVWTFTDNFEWAEGFHPRFGLVYIDFANQKRMVKSSGLWYSKFLSAGKSISSVKNREISLRNLGEKWSA